VNLRVHAEDAGWSIREAAWGIEENVLWRGSDATRSALERAGHRLLPLQRLIETRITWPIEDALSQRSRRTRVAIVSGAAALAIASAAGGAMSAADHLAAGPEAQPIVAATSVALQSADLTTLQGVTPQIQAGHAAPATPQPPAKTAAPPTKVAWQFAQAFVGYEVGHLSKKTDAAFAATATKPLVKSLAADPPRLPSNEKVPQARVLNIVLSTASKNQVTASVSLVRLRSISELRLTLTKTGDEWRVAQVLG
jgi:cell pole-organizing protein PopZ